MQGFLFPPPPSRLLPSNEIDAKKDFAFVAESTYGSLRAESRDQNWVLAIT